MSDSEDENDMRLLFAHPTILAHENHQGAIKSYRALAAAFAATGHAAEVVAIRPDGEPDTAAWTRISSAARPDPGATPIHATMTETAFGGRPSLARYVKTRAEFWALARRRLDDFAPDWVICENGTLDVRVARLLFGRKLVLSVSTAASLPFGPRTAAPAWSPRLRGLYRRIPRIFCASEFIREYIREYAGADAIVQHQVAYGVGPFRRVARFDGPVAMVNPTAHKGGSIFARLARALPERRFRAIESYARPVPELSALSNVEVVQKNDDLDRVLDGAAMLLVPSLWGEGFGMVCIDAMLRGIPVVASDDGGLPEATLGVSPCIPVTPGRLRRNWNGALDFAEPTVDLTPWLERVRALADERSTWERLSDAASARAEDYVRGLSIEPLAHSLERRA